MGEFLEHRYLEWLGGQVRPVYKNRSHEQLFSLLHAKEFVWMPDVPNDDNRVEDGLAVRVEFFHRKTGLKRGCTVLEVIIGLSRRLAFFVGGDPEYWAWTLITNIQLHRMSGHLKQRHIEVIDEVLEQLIWRTYTPDGLGGFFPLDAPKEDQRKVEIWYQMSAYIAELPNS